ncbi:MAG: hypothetical protein JWQ25_2494 [Daejeonella sp.]|nr:hypothetical protein [Daejeonella sp.]
MGIWLNSHAGNPSYATFGLTKAPIMASQISWQQFISFFAVTGLLYYFVVILLYYRGELMGLFWKQKRSNSTSDSDNQFINPDRNILGSIAGSSEFVRVDAEQLNFDVRELKDEVKLDFDSTDFQNQNRVHSNNEPPVQLQVIRKFIDELKVNIKIIKEAEGSREEFDSLFSATASKYDMLRTSTSIGFVNLLAEEIVNTGNLGYRVTADELTSLW